MDSGMVWAQQHYEHHSCSCSCFGVMVSLQCARLCVVLLWQSPECPHLDLVYCHVVQCIVAVKAPRINNTLP
jgi:hypothetical protein